MSMKNKMGGWSPGKQPGFLNTQQTILNQNDSNYLRSFICPKCQRPYDVQSRGNVFVGRVPLILTCDHTICEECVRVAIAKKNREIICGECHSVNTFENFDSKKGFQGVFPVNFYVFGLLYYFKPYTGEMSNINFKPAGFSFQKTIKQTDPRRSAFHEYHTSLLNPIRKASEVIVQECSQNKCDRPAQLSCTDCDEVFCETCSDILHKSARGLMKHKISPLNFFTSPELKETCNTHADSVLEFFCKNCEKNLCCYCVLGAHKEHEYYQMTHINEEDLPKFKEQIRRAEEMLKKLQKTEKKVIHHLNSNSASVTLTNNNSIDAVISRCFENLHGKLQVLEKQLRKEAAEYRNCNCNALSGMLREVSSNALTLTSLIEAANKIADGKLNTKMNVRIIQERLANALKVPCCLVHERQSSNNIQFVCGNLLHDLKDNFTIKSEAGCSYSLVTEEELPPDYEDDVSDTCSSAAASDLLSSGNASISLPFEGSADKYTDSSGARFMPAKRSRTDSVEKWIKNVYEDKKIEVEMPKFRKGDRASVTITHINSPECFYIHLNSMVGTLNRLSKNIDMYVRNFAPPVSKPELNSLYLINYAQDKQWCRGRVIDIDERESVFTVLFVDYGNTKKVKKQQIREISLELREPVPIAKECKLFDLYHIKDEWDSKAMNVMVHIVTGNDLLMVVMDEIYGVLDVDLITIESNTSVRDALLFLGYGIPHIQTPTELDSIKKDLKAVGDLKLYDTTVKFQKEDSLDVLITFVVDPFNVYINLNKNQRSMSDLQDTMQRFYTENKKGYYIYAPKIDMVVGVSYANRWYRGIIREVMEGKATVSVFLVDVGNTISIMWNFIRRLNERFIAAEQQAILVTLAHVKPLDDSCWSQNSIDFLNKYVLDHTSLKMVVNKVTKPIEVALFECLPTVHLCLNALLVQENLGESTGELSQAVEWPQYPSNVANKEETENFTMNMMRTIQTSTHAPRDKKTETVEAELQNILRKPVDILSAIDPGLIYVRFIEKKQAQHEFDLELQDFYLKEYFKSDCNWKKGSICVTYYNNKYFRGIILDILPDDKFKISLRDIAVEVVVKQKHIGELDEKFKLFPEFAIRCHLADVIPAGGTEKWPGLASEYLQEFFGNKREFYLAKKGAVDKQRKSMPVVIWYKEFIPGGPLESSKVFYHSINRVLLSNGLALKMKVPSESQSQNQQNAVAADGHRNIEDDNLVGDMSELTDWNEIMEQEFKVLEEVNKILSSEIQDWLPPLAFKNDLFLGNATFVNDKGEIYLHDSEVDSILQDMEKQMKIVFDKASPEPRDTNWLPGQLCSVKYFMNNNWYRGKIISNDKNAIKVIMVDYGNEEECEPKDLSKTLVCLDVPPFANKIVLHNVYPKSGRWQTSDLDILHAQIVDKQVTVTLKDKQVDGIATPAVVHLDSISINQLMIQNSPNLSIHPPRSKMNQNEVQACLLESDSDDLPQNSDVEICSESLSQSDSDVILEDDHPNTGLDRNTNLEDNELIAYKQAELPTVPDGSKVTVAVINVIAFNKVILEVVGSTAEKGLFDSISKNIKEEAAKQPMIIDPQIDMPCVAQFSDDGEWYRAKIVDNISGHINVWFVDFGNFEQVQPNSVRSIKPDWLKVPLEQHVALIHGIELSSASCLDEVLDDMSLYFNAIMLAEIVSRSPLTVRLFSKDSNKLSYQNLIDKGLLIIKENDTKA